MCEYTHTHTRTHIHMHSTLQNTIQTMFCVVSTSQPNEIGQVRTYNSHIKIDKLVYCNLFQASEC